MTNSKEIKDFNDPNFTGMIEWPDGTKHWKLNGKLHRLDGPAVERKSGTNLWFAYGNFHRVDGPALECEYSAKNAWYLGGKWLNTREVENWIKQNKIDLSTEEGQTAFVLRFS